MGESTHVGERPSFSFPARELILGSAGTPALDFLRVGEAGVLEAVASSVLSDILLRLRGSLSRVVVVLGFSVLRFFTVASPSRSEDLRLIDVSFFKVACSFFQLLERLVLSMVTMLHEGSWEDKKAISK